MSNHLPTDIRNVALCGHGGCGKTMLAEAILAKTKKISRMGSIVDGTTVSDFDPDEHERRCSLSTSLLYTDFAGKRFHILDAPGSLEFIGGMISAIAGADLVVICINAAKGIELAARKAWDLAGEMGLGRMIAITRMDSDNVNYQDVLESIRKVFGKKCVPFTIPQGEGPSFRGVLDVLSPEAKGEEVEALRMQITESAIECDETLMEKYLEGEEIPPDQVLKVMQTAVSKGSIVPVFCLAAEKDIGVVELLRGIAEWGTDPLHARRKLVKEVTVEGEGGKKETRWEPVEFRPDPAGKLLAHVFKVVSDLHIGKLAFLRIFSGTLSAKSTAWVSSSGKMEKIAQLYLCQGEKREEVAEAVTGDIVAVAKVEALNVGDTVAATSQEARFPPLPFPKPMAGYAVSAKTRGDEQKISQNFHRLCDEDPTFRFERDPLTSEQVIRGMGTLHLDVMLGRLKRRYGLEVITKPPKIPYLETVTQEAEGSYRHKKQTGGAGQFGEVHLRIKPNERGKGFEFINSIVGGVISQPFIPSVEKGVRAAMEKGPVAGYPMVDIIVELFFGKEHPVDSKDIAFQLAGKYGFQEIVTKCKPILLEPIVNMEIVFPSEYFGAISGDISSRRGRPTGTDQLGDMQVLKAQVPLAEVADYGSTLNAITQGAGYFNMELSHYEPVPPNIAQQVIAKAKAAAEENA